MTSFLAIGVSRHQATLALFTHHNSGPSFALRCLGARARASTNRPCSLNSLPVLNVEFSTRRTPRRLLFTWCRQAHVSTQTPWTKSIKKSPCQRASAILSLLFCGSGAYAKRKRHPSICQDSALLSSTVRKQSAQNPTLDRYSHKLSTLPIS
jgi:hypothetical protein